MKGLTSSTLNVVKEDIYSSASDMVEYCTGPYNLSIPA